MAEGAALAGFLATGFFATGFFAAGAAVAGPLAAAADRFTKRRLYQEQRVATYGLVDIEQQVVEVWTPDTTFPVFERERLVWHPAGATEPFILSCAELFRPA